MHGNLIEYRRNLVQKIGAAEVEALELRARMPGFRWDRFSLLLKIEEYKEKVKAIKQS